MTRPARLNPSRGIAASRASAAALRPCAPTQQPFAPTRVYKCPCGASVVLAPSAPLPGDWQTVVIAARKGRPERVGYRCGRCCRRALVMELLRDDLALRTVAIADARRLAAWAERAGLDERGIRIVIGRMQTERGSEAWARVIELCLAGLEDEG